MAWQEWLLNWAAHLDALIKLGLLIATAYVMRALIWTISHDVRWLRHNRIRALTEPRPPKPPKSEGERRGDSLAMRIGAAALLALALAAIALVVFIAVSQ